ncbi:MAG: YhgE/Pip domain-containing protein [Clostridiales Family XIII bacterium]|jgi:putative membrane protein|nr:YhgE/Pip domain-containing protein [Clostridiales Family XIII bacterium]
MENKPEENTQEHHPLNPLQALRHSLEWTIASRKLKRILSTRFMRIAIVALITIPTLYSGLYLYANIDPYGNMKDVPVALVVEDEPVDIGGRSIDFGQKISDEFVAQKPFDLHLTNRKDAVRGVDLDQYLFAIVIPKDFSGDIKTIYEAIMREEGSDTMPRKAEIQLITNDANSYLIREAADEAGNTIMSTIASQVSEELTDNVLASFKQIHDELEVAANGAAEILSGLRQITDNMDVMQAGLDELDSKTKTLPKDAAKLADGSGKVAKGNAQIAGYADRIENAATVLSKDWQKDVLPKIKRQVKDSDMTARGKKKVLSAIKKIDKHITVSRKTIREAVSQIDQLSDGAGQTAAGMKTLSEAVPDLTKAISALDQGVHELSDGLEKIKSGEKKLADNLSLGYKQIPALSDAQRKNVADVVGLPLEITNISQATAAGYAEGLAPFFIALSAWVGAYALFVLVKPFETEDLNSSRSKFRTTLGSFLPFALFGVLQMALLYLTITFAIGVLPVHPWITLGSMILMSLTYVMIIFCMVAALDKVGLFFGLVLLVVQLTSAGGTFPIQTAPAPFQIANKIFPMGYAVEAFRHTLYGGNPSIIRSDAVVMLTWFAAFFVVACLIAQRKKFETAGRS